MPSEHAAARSVFAVALACATLAAATVQSDFDTVKSRFLKELVPQTASERESLEHAVESSILPHFNASCLFDDIDYANKRRADWPVMAHLGRLSEMAALGAAGVNATSLAADVVCGLNWWLVHRPTCPNWYDQQISGPNNIGGIVLMLPSGSLAPNQSLAAKELMEEATWWDGWTGSNLLFMLRAQLMRGLFFGNETAVSQAFGVGFDAMHTFSQDGDGPQVDNSFHQHGPQLLSGSYGAEFTGHVLEFASFATGTAWQAPNKTLVALSNLLLDGQQYMMLFGIPASAPAGSLPSAAASRPVSWDWQVTGRSTSVEGSGFFDPRGFIQPSFVQLLASSNATGRQADWQAFSTRLQGSGEAEPLTGSRSFWDSDYVAHAPQGGKWRYSLHMESSRTIGGSCVNDQGKLARRKSWGASAVYYSGREYSGTFPLWNFYRPPGVTAPVNDGFVLDCSNAKSEGGAAFVGGVSLPSGRSVAVMDLEAKDEFSGHRSWFLFDDVVVLLGSRLSPHAAGAEIDTTLDTSSLQGDLTVGNVSSSTLFSSLLSSQVLPSRLRASREQAAASPLPKGEHTFGLPESSNSSTWVLHGRTGFIIPHSAATAGPEPPTQLRLWNEQRNASWSKIGVDTGTATADVFDGVVAHNAPGSGQQASHGSFALILAPAVDSPDTMQQLAQTDAGIVIKRSAGSSSSSFAGQEGALDTSAGVAGFAVWEPNDGSAGPGSSGFQPLSLGTGWSVAASEPCIVAMEESGSGSVVVLSIATPGAAGADLSLYVDRSLACDECAPAGSGWTRVRVTTPGASPEYGSDWMGAPVIVQATAG